MSLASGTHGTRCHLAILACICGVAWALPGCSGGGGATDATTETLGDTTVLPDAIGETATDLSADPAPASDRVEETMADEDVPTQDAAADAPQPADAPQVEVPVEDPGQADAPPADVDPADAPPADEGPGDVADETAQDGIEAGDAIVEELPPTPECCVPHPEWTVGARVCTPAAQPGYTLFNPISSYTTYLVDVCGRVVHTWTSRFLPGSMVYLLPDGSLLRAGREEGLLPCFHGGAGWVQRITWEGEVAWEFKYFGEDFVPHHDIEPMPNGNVLLVVWEKKTAEEAIAAGRDPALLPDGELWPSRIVEVQPVGPDGGNVVWEWRLWDHLVQDLDPDKPNYGVVAEHPELRDINFPHAGLPAAGQKDWLHTNAIRYNAELDQLVMSDREANEIVVIEHGASTGESAGHTGGRYGRGGDLLYRWGNPQACDLGTEADRQLFRQHDPQWIPEGYPGEGNLLIFNNGWERPDVQYSSVDEIVPPMDADGNYLREEGMAFGPAAPAWSYSAPNKADFYAKIGRASCRERV